MIDGNDPERKDTLACVFSLANLLAYTVMVSLLTIVIWTIGTIIIVLEVCPVDNQTVIV